MQKKIVGIVGGGAAGFYSAIQIAESNANLSIHIFEKSNSFLSKVKISGGGRCNVTHACFDPNELIRFYPRGHKEMLGPFYVFNPLQVIEWFEKKGITLVAENDGRMFPSTNISQTIIDCFLDQTKLHNIHLHSEYGIKNIKKRSNGKWELHFNQQEIFICDVLLITSGSSGQVWNMLNQLGHTIIPPVPSLFTFKTKDVRIQELMGVSVQHATCSILDSKNIVSSGPLLITHWGLSGPCILKLSAWAAIELAACNYKFQLKINFTSTHSLQECIEILVKNKKEFSKKTIHHTNTFQLPIRLYKNLCLGASISQNITWSEITKEQIHLLAKQLTECIFQIQGKSNFKDEFVTCGGIKLSEVDFKKMESKLHSNLYFAGEVLNIDAITGGFNFQAAWTTSFIASNSIASQ